MRGAGYDVVEPAPGTGEEGVEAAADAEEAARAAAYRSLKLKVTVGFVLSIVIFAGTMQMDWFTFLPVVDAQRLPPVGARERRAVLGRPAVLHHRLVGAEARHARP